MHADGCSFFYERLLLSVSICPERRLPEDLDVESTGMGIDFQDFGIIDIPGNVFYGPAIANSFLADIYLMPGPEYSAVMQVVAGKVFGEDLAVETVEGMDVIGSRIFPV